MTTFFDHLAELRRKIIACCAAVFVGAVAAHYYHGTIIDFLLAPLHGQSLIFLSPLDPLMLVFKVDLFVGLFVALPVITWSTLSFLKPAMKRFNWLLFCASYCLATILLLAGLAYAYFIMVPMTLRFLTSISIAGISNMITASSYFSFLLLELFLMASMFQIPLFVLAGVWVGAFDTAALESRRRYIYVGGLIVLAVITPTTDVFSLGCVSIPAVIIFEASLIVGKLLPRAARR
jgi:sec-independent protein translocase protein TatC